MAQVHARIDPPLAYTTVQTMLNILERKKKLKRELQGRAYGSLFELNQGLPEHLLCRHIAWDAAAWPRDHTDSFKTADCQIADAKEPLTL